MRGMETLSYQTCIMVSSHETSSSSAKQPKKKKNTIPKSAFEYGFSACLFMTLRESKETLHP